MIEMTLSCRHRIRNSSPGGLRPSTLPLGHGGSPQYWLSHVDGEETFFVSFKPPSPGTEPRTLAWNAAVLTTTLGPPPYFESKWKWPDLLMYNKYIWDDSPECFCCEEKGQVYIIWLVFRRNRTCGQIWLLISNAWHKENIKTLYFENI